MAVHVLAWDETPPVACRGGALAIGNFDGVHLGHQALLIELRTQAQAVGGPAVALTFDPHPLQLLRPQQFDRLLTTPAERAALLQRYGADEVILLRTSFELLRLSPAQFVEQVVCRQLQARAMAEGINFNFGHNRAGTIDTLKELCQQAGVRLAIVPPRLLGSVPVSSSKVRNALRQGDVQLAIQFLGRPYCLRGRVATGQRRGQQLGFPTANLEGVETLVPGDGVYAVRAEYRGTTWPAAANVGPNPTFGEQERKLEVHLIGFQGNLYGEELAIDFVHRLRDTRAFAGVSELVQQLRSDVRQAEHLFAKPRE